MRTYGCSLNASDSERISGLLEKSGFKIVESEDDALLVVVNTCIVKEPSQETAISYVKQLKKKGKKVVVAGCLSQALPEKLNEVSMIGVDQINNIVEVVEETLNGNHVVLIARDKQDRYSIPKKRKNKIIEIIPIAFGCLGNCSYCVVKKARGELVSAKKEDILKVASDAVRDGVKELWITAQDTGCYGKDIGTSLPELLRELTSLRGDYWIRLGMMNPNFALEYVDDLVELLRHEKMFRFIHIPVQSGSNKILKKMKRSYSVEEFYELIRRLKTDVPDVTLATDVICGFPGENAEDFNKSFELIRDIKPDILNISRYWKRPHTDAYNMKQLPAQKIKERSRKMTDLFSWVAFEQNKKWLNWEGEVIVDEKGKDDTWIARNYAYKPIVLRGNYFLGQVLRVKVVKTADYYLKAIDMG